MLIHLAETSNERGQYQSLIDTRFPTHLLSYAYRTPALTEFIKVWNMLVYLTSDYHDSTLRHGKSLDAINSKFLPRILIDSGAFTAYTTGKIITPEEYGEWALNFREQWGHKVKSLHFFNLDVIGDQIGSDKNLHKLESMGLEPIPIFTYGGDSKNLQYYLDNYEYIGLGGLVGRKTQEQLDWIRYCFSFVIKKYKKTSVLPKIHLLGITKEVILKEVPCYSSDSSSWMTCIRFGNGKAIGKKRIPKYTESEEALKITIITLKNEIRKYKKMQDDVTNLWKKRGIVWED
jgi:hypothetical protein